MSLAQEHAAVKSLEIEAKLAVPGISLEEEVRLKLDLFPLMVIVCTKHDLSWWVPGKSCHLELVADWIHEQDQSDEN